MDVEPYNPLSHCQNSRSVPEKNGDYDINVYEDNIQALDSVKLCMPDEAKDSGREKNILPLQTLPNCKIINTESNYNGLEIKLDKNELNIVI